MTLFGVVVVVVVLLLAADRLISETGLGDGGVVVVVVGDSRLR